MSNETLADKLAIRDVVENWVLARDSANWELFREQWHDDGYMMATWFQGPRDDFIRVSQEGFAKGVSNEPSYFAETPDSPLEESAK